MYWRLNKIHYPVYNLGPGRRLAIWTQGCKIRCPGCINPELWDGSGGSAVSLIRLASEIVSLSKDYDGITITGGEPFDQYKALVAFCTLINRKTNLDMRVYTGYRFEDLPEKYPDRMFEEVIDHLVDGPFIAEQQHDNPSTGSANQRILHLKRGTERQHVEVSGKRSFSYGFSNRKLFMAGIPGEKDIRELERKLKKTGIHF